MSNQSDKKRWVCTLKLSPPELKDNTADAERIVTALKYHLDVPYIDVDLSLLKTISGKIRESGYHVKCIFFKDRSRWILVDIRSADSDLEIAGLAVDLGTTRVVFRLINLETGHVIGETASDNPQIAIGPDILTRIHYADDENGLKTINGLIVNCINDAIRQLGQRHGISPSDILLIALAGNTTMTHLFLGIDPRWIIREPYIPVTNRPGLIKAADLGIGLNPETRVFVFPNTGSYFGGDLISGILYSGLHKEVNTSILVDVGTNAEVVLGNRDWLVACAGAAGPALEGGVSSIGMMAGPGVIDKVSLAGPDEIVVDTIGTLPPIGICGSGFIDLAAVLFLSGYIDIRGRLVMKGNSERIRVIDEMNHFLIVPSSETGNGEDLTISQASLDSLIRSKAAMYTILETITLSVGMELQDLDKFYVAGTFGSFINPESAITIGMIPDLPLTKYETLGNSSLGGATMLLESRDCIDEVDSVRDSITYLELNVDQGFMNRFSGAKFIPHTNPELFPSVTGPVE